MYNYVYKITDKKRKRYYIGCRTSNLKPKDDLGSVYFSSSSNRKFLEEQKKFPEQFIYEVIKTFPTVEEALEYEKELIQKFDVLTDSNYYNGRNKLECNRVDSRATKYTISYLGDLIKIARKEHGLSETDLAERIDSSRTTIQRIESGNTKVSIGTVFEACFVLGIPLMGCDKEHINNLSKMLSYMNKLLPEKPSNRITTLYDDF